MNLDLVMATRSLRLTKRFPSVHSAFVYRGLMQQAFVAPGCAVAITRVTERRVLVRLLGTDCGELGQDPFRELEKSLASDNALELFFDLHSATAASMDVVGSWALWLRRHRARLARVNMLTGSALIRLSAKTVQHFSELGEKARLYTDPTEFAGALHA